MTDTTETEPTTLTTVQTDIIRQVTYEAEALHTALRKAEREAGEARRRMEQGRNASYTMSQDVLGTVSGEVTQHAAKVSALMEVGMAAGVPTPFLHGAYMEGVAKSQRYPV